MDSFLDEVFALLVMVFLMFVLFGLAGLARMTLDHYFLHDDDDATPGIHDLEEEL